MLLSITTEDVQRNIAAICAVTQFNDRIRSHVLEDPDLSAAAAATGAINYLEARGYIAEALQWRIFSHCASVTRLYALYEAFVHRLIADWLAAVPALYSSYADLPDSLAAHHRSGIGQLLQKYGGPRTEKFTELALIEPLYFGLNSGSKYGLLPEAFFIDLRNLRQEELCNLFSRVSLGSLHSWLAKHSKLRSICEASGVSVASRLKDLVDYRNDAAHGADDIQEVLGISAFQQLADFTTLLCSALYEFVLFRYCDALDTRGRLGLVGEVTEYFRKPDASIVKMNAMRLSVGDVVIVRGRQTCFVANVLELQDNGTPLQTVDAMGGKEVGVRFSRTVDKQMKIFLELAETRG